MDAECDLVIRGSTVVTPGSSAECDLGISDGRMRFSEGVRTGRISLPRFVSLTSTNAARLFGLYPRKGTIAVGSDADLVVLDPKLRRVIDGRSMQSGADYSVYDGREVFGWPRFTVSRGEVVLEDGQVVAEPGRGQWLRRQPTAAL